MQVRKPPTLDECLQTLARTLRQGETLRPIWSRWGYLHWHEIQHRPTPPGTSLDALWAHMRLARMATAQPLPIADARGEPFSFSLPPELLNHLHWLDRSLAGRSNLVEIPEGSRETHIISSLMEEAIASSQLEGAATTRRVAKEMLRQGRKPRSPGEQMIFNNYRTIEALRAWATEPLTPGRIDEIHASMTHGTLDDPADEGRIRTTDDVFVADLADGEVAHVPPLSATLPARIEALCKFANAGPSPGTFVHPAVRAMILHFTLAYIHPYVDGNGRTARALFYWCMLNQGYDLFQYLSISRAILKSKRQYERAFLFTETDAGDVTYFLLYHIDAIRRAIEELQSYVLRKDRELRDLIEGLQGFLGLNHRQLALLRDALRHPHATYTIIQHQRSHGVVHRTARTDLFSLADRGFLVATKVGRTYHFRPAPDLAARIGRHAAARRPPA